MKLTHNPLQLTSRFMLASVCVFAISQCASGQIVIPGTGVVVESVGDDFEDETWSFDAQLPKVFNEKETTLAKNAPHGMSANKRWHEGVKRGQPDQIQRIATPPNGLAGSKGALLLRSLATGGSRPSHQQQQDDFIANVAAAIGKTSVSQSPSVVTRVWLPSLDQWEQRTGCHFAYRISLETSASPFSTVGRFRQRSVADSSNAYWPGMFINRELKSENDGADSAGDRVFFWMKATSNGQLLPGPEITTFGWWTLGMSVSPDGQVHYFAKPGVEDLTAADHIASSYPFGKRAARFKSFFFNVCSGDDGKTWSTPFVIDDPKMFIKQ